MDHTAPLRVTIWNEFRHERDNPHVRAIYPNGIHAALQSGLAQQPTARPIEFRTATLDEADNGLPPEVIEATDVLLWWGHLAHDDVQHDVVARVVRQVHRGMGFLPLHSAHHCRPFRDLMGTSCNLRWREHGETERLWTVDPSHPIVDGMDEEFFELPATEMYGEFFDIPAPDELIFVSWFEGGEVFRSGCTFRRGRGKIFYFRPGHETYPIYHHPTVLRIIANGIAWAAPSGSYYATESREVADPLSPINRPGERSA